MQGNAESWSIILERWRNLYSDQIHPNQHHLLKFQPTFSEDFFNFLRFVSNFWPPKREFWFCLFVSFWVVCLCQESEGWVLIFIFSVLQHKCTKYTICFLEGLTFSSVDVFENVSLPPNRLCWAHPFLPRVARKFPVKFPKEHFWKLSAPFREETSKVVSLHSMKVLLCRILVVRMCLDYSLSILAGETPQNPKFYLTLGFFFWNQEIVCISVLIESQNWQPVSGLLCQGLRQLFVNWVLRKLRIFHPSFLLIKLAAQGRESLHPQCGLASIVQNKKNQFQIKHLRSRLEGEKKTCTIVTVLLSVWFMLSSSV